MMIPRLGRWPRSCDLNDELRGIRFFQELQGDSTALTERLKRHVAYELLANRDAVFEPDQD